MSSRNTTAVIPGETITFNLKLKSYYGGPLVNADSIPIFRIYDPNDTLLFEGTSVHIGTGEYTATYTVDENAVLSDEYKLVWIALVNGNTDSDAWEYFRVVSSNPIYTGIFINDDWLLQIKKVLAFPKVSNLVLNDDQIKQYAVFPAMEEYFIKFPITDTIAMDINETATLAFPDEFTFGLTDCRVVDIGVLGGSGASFWDVLLYQKLGTAGNVSSYGRSGFNPNGLYQQRLTQRQAMKSQINALTTIKYKINYSTKQVYVYCSTPGKLNVTWAKFSNDFADIKHQRKFEVIQLAQANLLDHLADTFGIISDTSLDININVEAVRTRAKDLRQEIRDKWIVFPSVILLKAV